MKKEQIKNEIDNLIKTNGNLKAVDFNPLLKAIVDLSMSEYKEVVLTDENIRNQLHKGIELIENSDPNKYLDIQKIALEFKAGDTPFQEEIGGSELYRTGILPIKIGDLKYESGPFTVEWTNEVLNIIIDYVRDNIPLGGDFEIPLSGGNGFGASIEVGINDQFKLYSFRVINQGHYYQLGDELFIPSGSQLGNTSDIYLPIISEFPLSGYQMSLGQLFNLSFAETFIAVENISFTMSPLTAASTNIDDNIVTLNYTNITDNRGKSLYLSRACIRTPNDSSQGLLVGGEGAEMRLKIWYELRTFGSELE